MAKQITVRGVSKELSQRLEKLAEAKDSSLNATVLRILEDAVGLDARRLRLARYATWSEADVLEFNQALKAQRTVEPGDWE